MQTFQLLLVLSLTAVFGGFAFGQSVTSTYDEDYSLSRLKTYDYETRKRDGSDPLVTDTLTEKRIKEALNDELQANGYHPSSEGAPPDFLISFQVMTRDKTDERRGDRSYIQGSLIVDFCDAETKKLVWRGIASGVVGQDSVDLKLAEGKIKEATKLLLEQFVKDRPGF